jgi:DNA repair exonuclease SbcCD ATPase subunit
LIEWEKRVQNLRVSATRLNTLRDQLGTELRSKEQEVKDLGDKIDKLLKVGELFKMLMDRLVMDQLTSIKSIVTEGLQTIFFDQDLSFEAEVTTRRNLINVDLLLRDRSEGFQGPPLGNFGGGPISVSSLILRLISLRRLKRRPVLFLDETLSMVSEEYIDATGQFLQKLASTTGVDILLVTHNPAFLDHADIGYRAENVGGEEEDRKKLAIRKMRGSK